MSVVEAQAEHLYLQERLACHLLLAVLASVVSKPMEGVQVAQLGLQALAVQQQAALRQERPFLPGAMDLVQRMAVEVEDLPRQLLTAPMPLQERAEQVKAMAALEVKTLAQTVRLDPHLAAVAVGEMTTLAGLVQQVGLAVS